LGKYLSYASEKYTRIIASDHNLDFTEIYESLTATEGVIPSNFGAVYIINLIYFLSRREWPIYDKYAHKALKGIYMGVCPSEVYVSGAPDKYNTKEVANMYKEYVWLMENTFEKKNIERKLDRALWVYGHSNKKIEL